MAAQKIYETLVIYLIPAASHVIVCLLNCFILEPGIGLIRRGFRDSFWPPSYYVQVAMTEFSEYIEVWLLQVLVVTIIIATIGLATIIAGLIAR